jgi:hypothetical protein
MECIKLQLPFAYKPGNSMVYDVPPVLEGVKLMAAGGIKATRALLYELRFPSTLSYDFIALFLGTEIILISENILIGI